MSSLISDVEWAGFSPDGKLIYFTECDSSGSVWVGRHRGRERPAFSAKCAASFSAGRRGIRRRRDGRCRGLLLGGDGSQGRGPSLRPDGTLSARADALLAARPSRCSAGQGSRTLYVTSTRLPIPWHTPIGPNGVIYAVQPGVAGVAETMFVDRDR